MKGKFFPAQFYLDLRQMVMLTSLGRCNMVATKRNLSPYKRLLITTSPPHAGSK